MKAKPIFVITVPRLGLEDKEPEEITKILQNTFDNDYHVLVILSEIEIPKVEVFYEKDFNLIKYKELKKLILEKLKL